MTPHIQWSDLPRKSLFRVKLNRKGDQEKKPGHSLTHTICYRSMFRILRELGYFRNEFHGCDQALIIFPIELVNNWREMSTILRKRETNALGESTYNKTYLNCRNVFLGHWTFFLKRINDGKELVVSAYLYIHRWLAFYLRRSSIMSND